MHAFDDDIAVPSPAAARESEAPSRLSADGATTNAAPGAGAVQNATSLLGLQRQAGNAGVVQLLREGDGDGDPHGLSSLLGGGGGSPLDSDTRVQMESAIGADFSSVRVHTGGDADQSAKSLGAHAYTAGENLVFANGRYDPGSDEGQHTLAHELTHVVQQRSGPVDGTMTDTGVKVSDPSDPFERAAEANADRVTSMQAKADPAATPAAAAGAPPVQRHADCADEIQTLADPAAAAVQRDEDDEADDVQLLADPAASVQRDEDDEADDVQLLADPAATVQRDEDDDDGD